MERLTSWKLVLLIIVGLYVVIALPLAILDQLHIISINSIFHNIQLSPAAPHTTEYFHIADTTPVRSGDPMREAVQVPGKHYGIMFLMGTVDNVSQHDNQWYLSLTREDGKTLRDALPIAKDASITILTIKNGKTTSQNNVQPSQIVKGDVISVTVQVDTKTKAATITRVSIYR